MLTLAEAMLQIKYPRGEGYNSPDQTEELSVTQSEYESAAEREYAEQETLKYWYEKGGTIMNIKNEKTVINDKSLEFVTGGTKAPTLSATELKGSEYSAMFSNSQGLEPKEFHIYKNEIADPTSFKVGFCFTVIE